ncbi:hypothetical protein C9374_009749 [Naegleria lovaniensis]|uniref:Uncharacterized protein n=1 Tax=Naegleria lovaniensis TaxID=51637 RepID=A0AA88KRE7_NAELO|nr:uncharacterized protein C9374_009749 [Naegleria lovaniensis]KAG2393172.1 hypothetical protein C9374_009749 [Naegleria lovaniensis]
MKKSKGITPNAAVQSLKETLKKEHYSRVQWQNQYGGKFQKLPEEADLEHSSRREYVTSRMKEASKQPRRLHVEIDEDELDHDSSEEYDTNDPNLFSGYSSRFCGFHSPCESNFATTTSLEQSKKPIELDNKDNFRKKHWLKHYFEESAKMQNLFKSASGPGDKAASNVKK